MTCRRGGRFVKLSPTEYKLLFYYLLRNAGKVVSKAQILDHVWRYDFTGDALGSWSPTSACCAARSTTGEKRLLHTLRGVGYVLREPR